MITEEIQIKVPKFFMHISSVNQLVFQSSRYSSMCFGYVQ